ncbi:hypothetical protein Tco_0360826 [Tanacetum coccineum]
MANFATKHSIMTQEMVDNFCNSFYILAGVHPTAPERGKTISQFPAGKVGVYTRGALEKDPAPHFTTRQEQTVKLLKNLKAPFRRYPECFLCLVEMGLFDFIKTTNPRKVQAVEVQKGVEQVKLLESTKHCFMPLVPRGPGGSSSAVGAKVSAPVEKGSEDVIVDDVAADDVAADDAYLELAEPGEGEEEVIAEQPKKTKRKRLVNSSTLSAPIDTDTVTTTSTNGKLVADVIPDPAGPSQLEVSEGSDDSFYELATSDPSEAKRWYVPRWNITNDSLLDDGFSCRTLVYRVAPPAFFSNLRYMDCDQLYTEFNVGAARQICLGSEVRSRAEHELELKEKLKAKYVVHGKLLEERDSEILRLKAQLAKKEAETAEVFCLRDQVSSLSEEKSFLSTEVLALKVTITQMHHDISLLDSRATHLVSALNDALVACTEAGTKMTSLASERDRLISEVSSLHAAYKDFKEKMEAQQEEQAQELYNRVAELEAHEILGHALGRAVDFGMQEGLEASHEHGVAGRSLSVVDAYNPEAARVSYFDAVKALEDASFPLVDLLKSKKDAGMDEVLDCFLLDGPLAGLPKATYLQPCIKQLSVPIHHASAKMAIGETSLSFTLMNVHACAEGAKKHAASLLQLMMDIDSDNLCLPDLGG